MNNYKGHFVRVSAWGADDFALIMDFEGDKEECEEKFNEWEREIYNKVPLVSSKEYFRSLGFVEF